MYQFKRWRFYIKNRTEEDPPLTIAQAKRGLARTFGVDEKAIEITIRS